MENQNPANNAVSSNLAIYEQLRSVEQKAQKPFTSKGGFKGTDINPMWRIKRMTEIFGPAGIGWYYEVVHRSIEKSSDNETMCTFVSINLYIKQNDEWSKPIYGEGGNTFCERIFSKKLNKEIITTTDEAYKMALTDAFSNATKQLGLGADVWFENDKVHSTKYDQQQEQSGEYAPAAPAHSDEEIEKAVKEMKAATSRDDAQRIWNEHKDLQSDGKFHAACMEMIAKYPAAQAQQQTQQQQ